MTTKKTTTRLNLELSTQARERLESLTTRSDTSTLTDVVKRALYLYDVLLTHQQSGGSVVLKDVEGHEQRLILV